MLVRGVVLIIALCLGFSSTAFAGAWPRENGGVFVAGYVRQNTEKTEDKRLFVLYGEYGLSQQWVLATKLEYDLQDKDLTYAKLLGRWHFPINGGAFHAASGVGVEGGRDDQFLSPIVFLGRGFDTRFGSGWLDVEMNAKLSTQSWDAEYGAFALVGVKPHRKVMTMMALDLKSEQEQAQLNLVPSVAWQYTPGRQVHLEWTHALTGDGINEVAAGMWLEF